MFSLICTADFHQASEHLPKEARGRQCVTNCHIFLITVNYVKGALTLDSEDLNGILFDGSHLYNATREISNAEDFIDPVLLPNRISYKGHYVSTIHKGILTGLLDENIPTCNESVYHKLDIALAKAFSTVKNAIIIFKGVSVALYYDKSVIYVFDSHSRNSSGISCPDGTCVLGVVHSVSALCNYICQLSASLGDKGSTVQFDLHMLAFNKKCLQTPFIVRILDKRQGFQIRKKHKLKSSNSEDTPAKRQKVRNLMKNKSLIGMVDDRHVSLSDQSSSFSQVFSDEAFTPEMQETELLFDKLVSSGPIYVCTCCTQTYFSHFMTNIENLSESNRQHVAQFCTQYKSVGGIEWICQTCLNTARKKNIPRFWVNNGLKFPFKPNELDLSNLEERLVSPRLPFMQLREMPRGGQLNIKGNIVNVPADVNSTIKTLPRMMNENETIMLKLKRRLSYKHHVAFENIRPNKVFQAAKWLVANSLLFRNEGIVVNETWLQQPHDISLQQQQEDNSNLEQSVVTENDSGNGGHCSSSDNWTEDDSFVNRPTGNLDTFLQTLDFREFNQVLSVAPGEKNSPIGLFQDYHSEIFSFPTIYCGQSRTENHQRLVPLHYSDICKWELRNVDRRVAVCVPNIFFKLKRLQIKQIKDKVSLAIRKCKANGQSYTAGEILTPGFVDKLTMQDDGYKVLRTLRGSPPYWEAAKRDVFAMIRQLGIPTWFCSFSAAETKWKPLLTCLAKLIEGRDLTSDEAESLSWQEKCKLIKADPVTCARYFHNRVQVFIQRVLKHSSWPIGEILDYFYRVEFQQRGSPHIHMVAWVKNAPVHGVCSDQEVSAFVSKYIACSKDETIPALINYQTHRHARTCRKQGKAICRFNFPIPPMPETLVLHPINDTETRSSYEQMYEGIISCLDEVQRDGAEITFEDFLNKLEVDFDTYILIIRSKLIRSKVFLKRSVSESRINSYNSVLLRCWKANMDIQFILDPYSCISYIVSYISKGQRGLSNLLQDACREAREMDSDVRQQVRRIGNQFLTSVEIGAQEAAFLVLQMPLRKSTRDVIYVDTNKPDNRTSLIKSVSNLKELPANSKNIEMDNVLKRYKRRPKILDSLCYADFASMYELCKKQDKECNLDEISFEELPETEYNLDQDDDVEDIKESSSSEVVRFACGTRVRKRQRQKVIYCHVTPINQDREEHYREKIMLYTHWRNEENDLLCGYESYEKCYLEKEIEIKMNCQKYEKMNESDIESILADIDPENLGAVINQEAHHQNMIDVAEGTSRSAVLGCFDPGSELSSCEDYDLGDDLGISRRRVSLGELPTAEVNNEQYLQSVRALNMEQKQFFYHILHKVKCKSLPFYTFLSGGAGCGKSVLIMAIHQAVLKFLSHVHGEDPSSIKILLCAPTGKAAHNIGGCTIHSAFCIPASQGFHFKPLDMQQLNTLRSRFHDLKIVIIDEISMVGRGMLNFINLRLQEIKGCTKPFGGVSILAVGDLYQLKPVLDSWVFSQVYRKPELQCIASNLWIDLFDFFELTEVMRQKDDLEYALLLNRLQEGKHTEADLAVLEKRKVENLVNSNERLKEFPHLFCRRVDVHTHNMNILSNIEMCHRMEIEAIDTVSGNVSQSMIDAILLRLPEDPSKTMGLQKHLILGIGLPVELCLNLDTEDGLTNGASCIVRKFDLRVENSSRCSIVWVEFNSACIGKKWRLKYKHLYKDDISLCWTPVLETCRQFTYQYGKTYFIVRRQFPLYLASGKTIHKAQGSTIQEAVMHFGQKRIDHIHYVGLSRVTSLSGVHIMELNSSKISVSVDVEAEMERLRNTRRIVNSIYDMSYTDSSVIKVGFQNCRSLRKHISEIKQEHNLLNADVLGFVETRHPLGDEYEIAGI